MADDTADLLLPAWLAERYDGVYADGRRFDEIAYLQCKLILKPDRFTSAKVFREFAELVERAARLAAEAFRPAAAPDEARAMLGLAARA